MANPDDMQHIEAVLYTTGKYMTTEAIAEACGLGSVGMVAEAIKALQEKYSSGASALEIQEHEGRYKLNIKKQFSFIASKLAGETEFDGPTMKTLAVIAYKSPVLQSDIIKIRGNKAYDHVGQLKDDGLVSSERLGRSRLLKLSHKFFEYFDVAEKEVKEHLDAIEDDVRKNVAWKMGTTPEHIDKLEEELATKEDAEEPNDESNEEEQPEEPSEENTPEETGEKQDTNVYDNRGNVIGVLGDTTT